MGWGWVSLMLGAAGSSLFIRVINGGAFSYIHLLSGWTLVAVPLAVLAARRHDVKRHRRSMTAIYLGGLIIAGALAFFPGRVLWRVFIG